MNEQVETTSDVGHATPAKAAHWWLGIALLAFLIAFDLALMKLVQTGRRHRAVGFDLDWLTWLQVLVGLTQTAVLTFWAVLGRAWAPVRMGALMLGIGFWARLLPGNEPLSLRVEDVKLWTLVLLGQTLGISLALVGVYRSGLRVMRFPAWQPHREPQGRTRLQFSLAYLMACIGCAALALGILRDCGMFEHIYIRAQVRMDGVGLLAFAQAVIVLFCVYAVFGETPLPLRALPIAIVLLLVVLALAIGVPFGVAGVLVTDIALVLLPLCVLRGVGIGMGRLS